MIPVRYLSLCPICGGTLDENKLMKGACNNTSFKTLINPEPFEDFKKFFFKYTSKKLRPLQKLWAKRFLSHESFALVSPTGSGKTLMGISFCAYLSNKGRKSYIIVPTHLLVNDVLMKFNSLFPNVNVVAYHSKMSKKDRDNAIDKIKSLDFDVLISTPQFMRNHMDILPKFDFVFVDDIDALLKLSKNVDRILRLVGFSDGEIRRGERKKDISSYGNLIVSTATVKVGPRARLFFNLLNFSVGGRPIGLRDVVDIYVKFSSSNVRKNLLLSIVKSMGYGGLIYTSTKESASEVYEFLKSSGVRANLVVSGKDFDFSSFLNGGVDVLVGVASPYGLLVRGLDHPKNFRYTVFYEPPLRKIDLNSIDDKLRSKIVSWLRIYNRITDLSDDEVWNSFINGKLTYPGALIVNGEMIIPDVKVYIQATGRTSRMFYGGMTKGASFLFVDDDNLIHLFKHRFSFLDITLRPMDEVDLSLLKKEIEESRTHIGGNVEDVIPVLFIVESPTKAKHISSFFGKPSIRLVDGIPVYEVSSGRYVFSIMASLGHVVDLTTDREFNTFGIASNSHVIPFHKTIKRCKKCGYQFTDGDSCPKCKSKDIDDALHRINVIRKLAYEAENVFIATDPDNEGEKIAFDIYNLITPVVRTQRLEFHEITPRSIREALQKPRHIDEEKVKAQIVRRVEDRLIGFALSSLLKKLYKNKNLSAGRAQTPTLSWIIDAYKKHLKKVRAARLIIEDTHMDVDPTIIPNDLEGKMNVEISANILKKKVEKEPPLPPYTTDTLLMDIAHYLKINSSKAMDILQELFENGLITYHRTDSTHVSEKGYEVAKTILGNKFVPRSWSKGEVGTHECIRPTKPYSPTDLKYAIKRGLIHLNNPLTKEHIAIYALIFNRFIASQTEGYVVEKTSFNIQLFDKSFVHECVTNANGLAYEFYTFKYKVCNLSEGKHDAILNIFYKPQAHLLMESDIIKMMREKGIGRPSTYSTILSKLRLRRYVKVINGRYIPTKLGMSVEHFLMKNYEPFVGESMTKTLEKQIEQIEKGEIDYTDVLKLFIKSFESTLGQRLVVSLD